MNKDIDRIRSWKPYKGDLRWFEEQSSLEEVWDKCEEPSCLFFICRAEKALNLKKEQSVAIAIAVASRALDKYEAFRQDDDRPRKAIEAAQAWLDNPTEDNVVVAVFAASYAAYAANAANAARAARNAACAVAHPATSYDTVSAAYAAHAAAYSTYDADAAAYSIVRVNEQKAHADIFRSIVPNPFKQQTKE